MNNKNNLTGYIRRISTILLLIFLVIQIVVVLFLAADVDDFEIDEIHEICGFIFLGLMIVHIAVHWKSLKSLLKFKN